MLFNAAMLLGSLGVIGDLLDAQRTLSQRTFERVRRIELQLGVEPSHYEPGAAPAQASAAGTQARGERRRRGQILTARRSRYELRSPTAVPTGNTFDKYGSTNPVVRRLMAGFEGTLDELFTRAAPGSVLDVGCGEGVLTERWAAQLGTGGRVVGIDLEDPKLRAEWAARARENLEFLAGSADALPFDDGEFELAAAIEVLEHVPDPERAVAEMARVASRHLLVSVPREPLWRALNVARGAYLRDLGNTPGHVNHWSKRGFLAAPRRCGEVMQARSPFPWTMLLVRVE